MDLMCALHLDRPEHLHIHYVFWEKEPKVKNQRAAGYIYRKKSKIPLDVIDKMTERLNANTIDEELAEKRQKKERWYTENIPNFTDVQGLKTIHTIEKLEWDYKRRLGNIVLRKVREIQKETYKRNPRKKYKTNDKYLKSRLAISSRKVRGIMDGLFSSVAELFSPEMEKYHNRLKEIEEEMQEEYAKEIRPQEQVKPTSSKWDWSK